MKSEEESVFSRNRTPDELLSPKYSAFREYFSMTTRRINNIDILISLQETWCLYHFTKVTKTTSYSDNLKWKTNKSRRVKTRVAGISNIIEETKVIYAEIIQIMRVKWFLPTFLFSPSYSMIYYTFLKNIFLPYLQHAFFHNLLLVYT